VTICSNRFPAHASTTEEAWAYLRNRGMQLRPEGYRPLAAFPVTQGNHTVAVAVTWGFLGLRFFSVYLLSGSRGKGLYKRIVTHSRFQPPLYGRVLTVRDCNLHQFLVENDIPARVAHGYFDSDAYAFASSVLTDKYAKRSGRHYMEHVEEGCFILECLSSDVSLSPYHISNAQEVQEAFCLHAVLQQDEGIKEHLMRLSMFPKNIPVTGNRLGVQPYVVGLAVEYRSVANDYLAHMPLRDPNKIRLSPVPEVNAMLIADKVQNYADFRKYASLETHPNFDHLNSYFLSWFEALGISGTYQQLVDKLSYTFPPLDYRNPVEIPVDL